MAHVDAVVHSIDLLDQLNDKVLEDMSDAVDSDKKEVAMTTDDRSHETDEISAAATSHGFLDAHLLETLQAFISAGSIKEKQRILDDHRETLLGDEADQAIGMMAAREFREGDEQAAAITAYHAYLLILARTMPLAQAWQQVAAKMQKSREGQVSPDDADPLQVTEALQDWINAPTWDEKRRILDEAWEVQDHNGKQQPLLASNVARFTLLENARRADGMKQEGLATRLYQHYGLLYWAYVFGRATAWVECEHLRHVAETSSETFPEDSPLRRTVLTWLNTRPYWTQRRYLQAHPEILGSDGERIVEAYLWRYFGRREDEDTLRDHLRLLRDARARGGDMAAISEAYVNLRGGLTLDVPSWLNDLLERETAREEQDEHRPTLKRLAFWVDVIARSQNEALPTPLIASLQLLCATVLRSDASESRPSSLDEAIALYTQMLAINTRDAFPLQWAETLSSRGEVYQQRLRGDQAGNQEAALHDFGAALQVYTRDAYPEQWAKAHLHRGNAFLQRLRGNSAENVEAAITNYGAALRVYTRDAYPEEWAKIHVNLGNSYHHRLNGEAVLAGIAQNQELAIAFYNAGLQVFTRDTYPREWAMIHGNLGSIYDERLQGNKAENVEAAIRHLDTALQVFTRAAFPLDWAQAHNNRGNAYQSRMQGEKVKNIEQAIADYDAALQVYTRDAFPKSHRDTQLNLALAAWHDLAAIASSPQARQAAYERADRAYQAAREMQIELGWLASDATNLALLRGESAKALEMYASHAAVLIKLGRTQEAAAALEAGRAQAMSQAQALDNADLLRGVPGNLAERFQQARADWQAAQAVGDNMAAVRAREALGAARIAIRAAGRREFLPGEPTWDDLRLAARAGQAVVYLAATEEGGIALVIPPDVSAETQPLVLRLTSLTPERVNAWLLRTDPEREGIGGYQIALQRLADNFVYMALDRVKKEDGDDAKEQILQTPLRALAAEIPKRYQTLRVAFEQMTTSWQAEERILARGEGAQRQIGALLQARLNMTLAEALDSGVLRSELNWFFMRAELDALLPDLSKYLMRPLRNFLVRHGLGRRNQRVALIPCGKLGALPLHAAMVQASWGRQAPFQDICRLSYQASAVTLAKAQQRLSDLPQAGPFYGVGNPLPLTTAQSLTWGAAEIDALISLARRSHRAPEPALLEKKATKAAVITLMGRAQEETHRGGWLFMALHGHSDASDPEKCFVLLSDDERLTLPELQRGKLLEGLRCLIADGCVTALGDLAHAPDELSSFAAGGLQAGTPAVLATQWSVNDQSEFLLMLRVGKLILGNPRLAPAEAVREAARWLRRASVRDLESLANLGTRNIEPAAFHGARSALRGVQAREGETSNGERGPHSAAAFKLLGETIHGQEKTKRPYEHPIYWAPLVAYGV